MITIKINSISIPGLVIEQEFLTNEEAYNWYMNKLPMLGMNKNEAEHFISIDGAEFQPLVYEDYKNDYMQKQTAKKYLANTDWYVVRKMEKGIDIPQEISDQRQLCRELL